MMKFKSHVSKLLIVLFTFAFTACNSASEKQNDAPPNIIFIMTDDHARRTVSAYEGAINNTPNIDRLASEGAMFMNSFVANSICNPSRAAILTGKHAHKNGVVGNAAPWNKNQPLLPRLLQQNGYTTALIGKWHMNNPPGDEFDYSNRLTGAGKQGFYYNPEFVSGDGTTTTVNGHSTYLVTDQSLQWLDENSTEGQKPFMLFVQYKAPHVPRMPEFRFLDKYSNDTLPEPETLFDDYSTRQPYASQANMGIHYRPVPPMKEHNAEDNIYFARMSEEQRKKWHVYKDPEAEEYNQMKEEGLLQGKEELAFAYQKFIKDYVRLIYGVDKNVGRVLNWLDEHPEVKENTIVVYTSDQGFFTGQHGWAEKRFMYDESIKTPLIVRWPGRISAGSKIESTVQNIDFAPTLLQAAGTEIPAEMQGRSFIPLLDGEAPGDWRNSIYYHYYDHGIHGVPRHDGVRTDRYKLIHFYTDNAWELYDLSNDPNEVNNLYGNKEYDDVTAELKKELDRLRNYYEVPDSHFEAPYVRAGKNQQL